MRNLLLSGEYVTLKTILKYCSPLFCVLIKSTKDHLSPCFGIELTNLGNFDAVFLTIAYSVEDEGRAQVALESSDHGLGSPHEANLVRDPHHITLTSLPPRIRITSICSVSIYKMRVVYRVITQEVGGGVEKRKKRS